MAETLTLVSLGEACERITDSSVGIGLVVARNNFEATGFSDIELLEAAVAERLSRVLGHTDTLPFEFKKDTFDHIQDRWQSCTSGDLGRLFMLLSDVRKPKGQQVVGQVVASYVAPMAATGNITKSVVTNANYVPIAGQARRRGQTKSDSLAKRLSGAKPVQPTPDQVRSIIRSSTAAVDPAHRKGAGYGAYLIRQGFVGGQSV